MDLRRSGLGLLVSLDALLSERGVTAAARHLGISQPALSAQLARLRDIFGDDLLVGNAHGMTPTPRAEAFHGPLHTLLGELSSLIAAERSFDPASAERAFGLGATDLLHAITLPPLFAALSELAPGVRVSAMPFVYDRYADDMERGRIDVAITTGIAVPAGFSNVPFLEERFCVIWRRGHPELGETLTLDAFCQIGQLMVSTQGGGFHGAVDHALAARGLTRRVSSHSTRQACTRRLSRFRLRAFRSS